MSFVDQIELDGNCHELPESEIRKRLGWTPLTETPDDGKDEPMATTTENCFALEGWDGYYRDDGHNRLTSIVRDGAESVAPRGYTVGFISSEFPNCRCTETEARRRGRVNNIPRKDTPMNKTRTQAFRDTISPLTGKPLAYLLTFPTITLPKFVFHTLLLGRRPASRIGRVAVRTITYPFRRVYRRAEKSLGLALDVLTVAGTLWAAWQYSPGVYDAVTPVVADAYASVVEFVQTIRLSTGTSL